MMIMSKHNKHHLISVPCCLMIDPWCINHHSIIHLIISLTLTLLSLDPNKLPEKFI